MKHLTERGLGNGQKNEEQEISDRMGWSQQGFKKEKGGKKQLEVEEEITLKNVQLPVRSEICCGLGQYHDFGVKPPLL